MRNPEIPGREISAKAIPTRGTLLDPASGCGVTRCDAVSRKYPPGHSALDAESRNTRAGNIGKGNTHKRHFTGPRIVVRGDPVLDAVSRNTGSGTCPLRPRTGPRIVVRGDSHTGPRHLVIPRLDAVLHVIPRLDAVSRNTRAGNIGKSNAHKRHFTGPRIAVRGDRHVIPRYDAVLHVIPHLMRNPGIPAAALVLCGPVLDPASWCGVTHTLDPVTSSYRALTRYPEISAKAIPTRGTLLDPASGAG